MQEAFDGRTQYLDEDDDQEDDDRDRGSVSLGWMVHALLSTKARLTRLLKLSYRGLVSSAPKAAVSFERGLFQSLAAKSAAVLVRLERGLRPRWPALTGPAAEPMLGAVIVILGIVLALPIPFGNQPPAFAITLIALGLLEHDGAFVAAGVVAALISVVIVVLVVGGAATALLFFGHQLAG